MWFPGLALVLGEVGVHPSLWPTHHYNTEGLWAEATGTRTHPSHILHPGCIYFWTVVGGPCFEAE